MHYGRCASGKYIFFIVKLERILIQTSRDFIRADHWIISFFRTLLSFRVCLHGSGVPHVGEVIHLGEIKKKPSFTCGSSRGSDGGSNRLYTGKKHKKVSLKENH